MKLIYFSQFCKKSFAIVFAGFESDIACRFNLQEDQLNAFKEKQHKLLVIVMIAHEDISRK